MIALNEIPYTLLGAFAAGRESAGRTRAGRITAAMLIGYAHRHGDGSDLPDEHP